ncbi:uncharacterized protein G2W53_036472 [Senna tora]|uniref:Uncharacterized protein n=1 Tax=Senna tora TaxID=362788 RepID=A0A834T507_9FABA|nr:uncharacterized protein G2W53_036472 [Senna tora]
MARLPSSLAVILAPHGASWKTGVG